MIQRFSVHFEDADEKKLPEVLEGLAALGFPADAIRVWREAGGRVNVHAFRDGHLDTMKRLDPERMEDHCVEIWGRIGYANVTLTEFPEPINAVEFGKGDYDAWELG